MPAPTPERVYLDYNATAPVRPEVRARVEPLLFGPMGGGGFGNASSIHWAGQTARRELERARAQVAALFARKPSEVVFTSGGTEADHLALHGVLLHPSVATPRLVTTAVEHPAVLEAAASLERRGVAVTRVRVHPDGALDLAALDRALDPPPTLVSVMAVNNETGVVMDLAPVAARTRRAGAWLHVDAVQAPGRIALPDADLVSLSGHKLGGLKGAGALITRASVPLLRQLPGGPQERGLRAGTEDVPAAVALAEALALAEAERAESTARLAGLTARLEAGLEGLGARIVGGTRAPGTVTVVFSGLDSEALLQALDLAGIAASSGSACSSGSLTPSHVLMALGYPEAAARSAVRFSFGWASRPSDVDRVLEVLPALLAQVRGA